MVDKRSGGRVVLVLASLRLAVVTMLTLGSVCAYATFYEMRNGTPAVQRDIYQTPWFALILATLGVNVASVMVSRYPWTRHHIGFLVAHVGILAILAGSLVSIYRGLDSNLALFEGETGERVTLHDRSLQLALPTGARASFPVLFEKHPASPGREQRFAVPGQDLVLVADESRPHVGVSESFASAESGTPALHFQLQAPMATQDGWLVPDDPERSRLDLFMVSFAFRSAPGETAAQELLSRDEGRNHVSFVTTPAGLWYSASDGQGGRQTGAVVPGQPVRTGWAGLGLMVDQYLPSAALVRQVVKETPPAKEERRRPAVLVHLEGQGQAGPPEWVLWGEQRALRVGSRAAAVAYRSPEVALPFKVTLLRFNDESYPGSRMASTYESTVRIDDPREGSFQTLVSMNHPLHYRGYIFFQSSFVEGRPMMSIFSVARAPGLPLVYLGVALIGTGIIWMFYVKPYLARRQAQAALVAHRAARETPHEAKPAADAVAARPRPAAPAAGGA
ncbi:MAG TPA: cytochrome c biogenesis protein ResB [Vicinamibacteria bacterium]|nr:cytochrome c biogenesis protein ResB [Vicinamibacteria bacterium]